MPEFFATTAKEMEPLLADELRDLGASRVESKRAGASFEGDLAAAYRACLWSRVANRVFLPLKSFPAPTPEKLYGGVKSIRWSDHFTAQNTMAVDFSSSRSQIAHSHFGALKSKDAIVDQFRDQTGTRPSVDAADPDIRINVYLLNDVATVSLDLSGASLHERGYRERGVAAPLKENLAAAILLLSGWKTFLDDQASGSPERIGFLDPMCGSGTLPIEAALIATNTAPGLIGNRKWGFLAWKKHDAALWAELKREAEAARARKLADAKRLPEIIGYDHDFRAVHVALANLERAGLRGIVHVEKRELSTCVPHAPRGMLVANPPYGERLGQTESLKPLYRGLGDLMKQKFKGWTAGVFTGNPDLAKVIGLKAARRFVLFNGAMECRLLKYDLY